MTKTLNLSYYNIENKDLDNLYFLYKQGNETIQYLINYEYPEKYTFLKIGNKQTEYFKNHKNIKGVLTGDEVDEYQKMYTSPLEIKCEKNKTYFTLNNSKLFKRISFYDYTSNDYNDYDYHFKTLTIGDFHCDIIWLLVRFNLYSVKYNLDEDEIGNKYNLYNYLFIPVVLEKRMIDYFTINNVVFHGNTYSTNNDFFGKCYKNNVFKPTFISDVMYELAKLPDSKDISVFITDYNLTEYLDFNVNNGYQKISFFDLSKTKDNSFQYLLGANFKEGFYRNRYKENNNKNNYHYDETLIYDCNNNYFHHINRENYILVVDKDVYLKNVKTGKRFDIFSEFNLTISKTFAQKLREGFSIENISKSIFSIGMAGLSGGPAAAGKAFVKETGSNILKTQNDETTYNKSDANYITIYKDNVRNSEKLIFDFNYPSDTENEKMCKKLIKILYDRKVDYFKGER